MAAADAPRAAGSPDKPSDKPPSPEGGGSPPSRANPLAKLFPHKPKEPASDAAKASPDGKMEKASDQAPANPLAALFPHKPKQPASDVANAKLHDGEDKPSGPMPRRSGPALANPLAALFPPKPKEPIFGVAKTNPSDGKGVADGSVPIHPLAAIFGPKSEEPMVGASEYTPGDSKEKTSDQSPTNPVSALFSPKFKDSDSGASKSTPSGGKEKASSVPPTNPMANLFGCKSKEPISAIAKASGVVLSEATFDAIAWLVNGAPVSFTGRVSFAVAGGRYRLIATCEDGKLTSFGRRTGHVPSLACDVSIEWSSEDAFAAWMEKRSVLPVEVLLGRMVVHGRWRMVIEATELLEIAEEVVRSKFNPPKPHVSHAREKLQAERAKRSRWLHRELERYGRLPGHLRLLVHCLGSQDQDHKQLMIGLGMRGAVQVRMGSGAVIRGCLPCVNLGRTAAVLHGLAHILRRLLSFNRFKMAGDSSSCREHVGLTKAVEHARTWDIVILENIMAKALEHARTWDIVILKPFADQPSTPVHEKKACNSKTRWLRICASPPPPQAGCTACFLIVNAYSRMDIVLLLHSVSWMLGALSLAYTSDPFYRLIRATINLRLSAAQSHSLLEAADLTLDGPSSVTVENERSSRNSPSPLAGLLRFPWTKEDTITGKVRAQSLGRPATGSEGNLLFFKKKPVTPLSKHAGPEPIVREPSPRAVESSEAAREKGLAHMPHSSPPNGMQAACCPASAHSTVPVDSEESFSTTEPPQNLPSTPELLSSSPPLTSTFRQGGQVEDQTVRPSEVKFEAPNDFVMITFQSASAIAAQGIQGIHDQTTRLLVEAQVAELAGRSWCSAHVAAPLLRVAAAVGRGWERLLTWWALHAMFFAACNFAAGTLCLAFLEWPNFSDDILSTSLVSCTALSLLLLSSAIMVGGSTKDALSANYGQGSSRVDDIFCASRHSTCSFLKTQVTTDVLLGIRVLTLVMWMRFIWSIYALVIEFNVVHILDFTAQALCAFGLTVGAGAGHVAAPRLVTGMNWCLHGVNATPSSGSEDILLMYYLIERKRNLIKDLACNVARRKEAIVLSSPVGRKSML